MEFALSIYNNGLQAQDGSGFLEIDFLDSPHPWIGAAVSVLRVLLKMYIIKYLKHRINSPNFWNIEVWFS